MIYKVLYQDHIVEVPVRENTKAMYVEATSDSEVREKLYALPIQVEFIQELEGKHLEYERTSEDFEVIQVEDL